ncbi:glycerophosphodiester phosphodiesterase [Rhabdothermincola salaria]|uniref:glycerophosphodiester phosphodiesterase n=1 Tax=Rhabdothermincola salaria TaxID=2903142 RepID=UPI001E37AAD0|nr:glycerophosphodiester phosphodiesterase [Rhabdothermincola salaria]
MPRFASVRRPPIGFAHRGARAHAADNTLEAFRLALRLGATGLETDAWSSADGQAVLDHDGVVGGRMRRRPIAAHRRDELPGHLVTLAELYADCGTDFELSVDVKDEAVAAELVASARDVGAEERLWLCHPDWELAATWRALSPSVKLVDSTRLKRMEGGAERHVARAAAAGLDAVNLHHSDWTGGLVALVHRFEMLALGWDVQFDRTIDNLLDTGIDGVFSDHVDRMMARIHARA